MHYFTEDEKIKELKAIFEAMENAVVEPEVDDTPMVDPLQAKQDTVDSERKRRELANLAIKNGESKVKTTNFDNRKSDLEAQVAKKDFAINFLTKQMEVTQDPEDKQGFADLIQDKVNEKNVLLTQIMNVSSQAGTQASISANNSAGTDDVVEEDVDSGESELKAVLANLQKAAFDNETVTIAGGEFSGQILKDLADLVAIALSQKT